jgi:hypothetical protein
MSRETQRLQACHVVLSPENGHQHQHRLLQLRIGRNPLPQFFSIYTGQAYIQ